MKHNKVIEQWYEVDFNTSYRYLGKAIDDFLKGSPELSEDEDLQNELWEDNHTVLRDFDGDFSGILIYHTEYTRALIKFICTKLDIKYEDVKDLNFKLIG